MPNNLANVKSGFVTHNISTAEIMNEYKTYNYSSARCTFYCEECFFQDHESHTDSGSIKSMLTKEYQEWKVLSDRLDTIKALWERNYGNYSHLIKQIKKVM